MYQTDCQWQPPRRRLSVWARIAAAPPVLLLMWLNTMRGGGEESPPLRSPLISLLTYIAREREARGCVSIITLGHCQINAVSASVSMMGEWGSKVVKMSLLQLIVRRRTYFKDPLRVGERRTETGNASSAVPATAMLCRVGLSLSPSASLVS